MNIQWYPGHMTKTRRIMEEDIKLVDAVCEVVDARIPRSSGNPDIAMLAGTKPRLVVLNRVDQADERVTKLWRGYWENSVETVANRSSSAQVFIAAVQKLLEDKLARLAERGQTGRSIKLMICGIPNVGKSTLINTLAGRKAAKTEDRPGVTRGRQWIQIGTGLSVLDTPGILWPKFDDETTGLNLAFTGAIKDDILDVETLGARLFEVLKEAAPQSLTERYKIELDGGGFELLERAARKRGFLISGGELDIERMSRTLLDEFRGGRLGRISLERPD